MGSGADSETPQQYIQRSLARYVKPGGAAATSFDPLDPTSIAAKQRAARQMREGLNSSYGTSTRGTDLPQGGGLQGPSSGGGDSTAQDAPIITDMTGRNTGTTVAELNAAAAAQAAAAAAEAKRQQDLRDARENGGRTPRNPSGPQTYRF